LSADKTTSVPLAVKLKSPSLKSPALAEDIKRRVHKIKNNTASISNLKPKTS
jgi:hypothetical protein